MKRIWKHTVYIPPYFSTAVLNLCFVSFIKLRGHAMTSFVGHTTWWYMLWIHRLDFIDYKLWDISVHELFVFSLSCIHAVCVQINDMPTVLARLLRNCAKCLNLYSLQITLEKL